MNEQDKNIQRATKAAIESSNVAYESYLRVLQRLTRSFKLMENTADDMNSILNDQIKTLSDSGVIRNLTSMMKKSENLKIKTAGNLLESGANLIDTVTTFEQAMIKTKTSAIQLGASFGQTTEEVSRFANATLSHIGELKSTLHVQQDRIDQYLNTVKMMAGSYAMLNAQIIDSSGNVVDNLQSTLFKFSNAFQYDIIPLTKMVYGAAGRMGASDDPKIAAYRMMEAWVDATKMLRIVGMSTTKGLGDLASIVAGTEGSIVDGTRRIANITSLYTSVFTILRNKGQEALTDEFTRIMDDGMRNLSPVISGLMVSGGFAKNIIGDVQDPLVGGMMLRAAVRAGKDLRTGKNVSTNDVMDMIINTLEGSAKTPLFVWGPEFTKGLTHSQANTAANQSLLFDQLLSSVFGVKDKNQAMLMRGILIDYKKTNKVTEANYKKMQQTMGNGLSEAEAIESMKRTTLQQIWDHVSGMYMKAIGMAGNNVESTKRKSDILFSLTSGSKQHYIDTRLETFQKENKTDKVVAATALGKQWENMKRADVMASSDPIHGSEYIADTLKEISKKYALRVKLTAAEEAILNDPASSAEAKMSIYGKALGIVVAQDLSASGIKDEAYTREAITALNPWSVEAEANEKRARLQGEALTPMGGSGGSLAAAFKETTQGSSTSLKDIKQQGIPSGDTEGVTMHGQGQILRHQEGEATIGASDMLRIQNMGGLQYILSKAKMLSEANLSGAALDELKAEVAGVESGPDGYYAANKQTSATGKYQFVQSTAKELYEKHTSAFSNMGVSTQDFSSKESMRQMMFGPEGAKIQETMMGLAVQDYAKGLRNINIPVTAETLKLVHFMGLGGFKKWIKEGASLDYNPTAGGVKNATVGQYLGLGRRSGAMASAVASQLTVGGMDNWFDVDAGPQEIKIDKLIAAVNTSGARTGEEYRLQATIRF